MRKVAQSTIPADAADVARALFSFLQTDHSWAISAPQMGFDCRMFVMATPKVPGHDFPSLGAPFVPTGIERPMHYTAIVNPIVTDVSVEMETDYESCKSAPGLVALVPRHKWVEVRFSTPDEKIYTCRLSAHPARIFQHEYDHLEGILFLDRIFDNCDILMEDELGRQMTTQPQIFRKKLGETSSLLVDSWIRKYYV